MGRRLLFLLLVVPMSIILTICAFGMIIASFFMWLFTGRTSLDEWVLKFPPDWLFPTNILGE